MVTGPPPTTARHPARATASAVLAPDSISISGAPPATASAARRTASENGGQITRPARLQPGAAATRDTASSAITRCP